jgi:hypothetical protein
MIHVGGNLYLKENTYVFNNKFTGGEVGVVSPQGDRDAMWYGYISENHERYWIIDGTYKPVSVPP